MSISVWSVTIVYWKGRKMAEFQILPFSEAYWPFWHSLLALACSERQDQEPLPDENLASVAVCSPGTGGIGTVSCPVDKSLYSKAVCIPYWSVPVKHVEDEEVRRKGMKHWITRKATCGQDPSVHDIVDGSTTCSPIPNWFSGIIHHQTVSGNDIP